MRHDELLIQFYSIDGITEYPNLRIFWLACLGLHHLFAECQDMIGGIFKRWEHFLERAVVYFLHIVTCDAKRIKGLSIDRMIRGCDLIN